MLKVFLYILLSLARFNPSVCRGQQRVLHFGKLTPSNTKRRGAKVNNLLEKIKSVPYSSDSCRLKKWKKNQSICVRGGFHLSMWRFQHLEFPLNPRVMKINQPVCQSSYHNCVCWDRSARGVSPSLLLSLSLCECVCVKVEWNCIQNVPKQHKWIFRPVDSTWVISLDFKAKYAESCECETHENQEKTRKGKTMTSPLLIWPELSQSMCTLSLPHYKITTLPINQNTIFDFWLSCVFSSIH